MKKTYTKPMVEFEEVVLDTPISANCASDYIWQVKDLMSQGWFSPGFDCTQHIQSQEELNMHIVVQGDDTLCYFTAFSKPLVS